MVEARRLPCLPVTDRLGPAFVCHALTPPDLSPIRGGFRRPRQVSSPPASHGKTDDSPLDCEACDLATPCAWHCALYDPEATGEPWRGSLDRSGRPRFVSRGPLALCERLPTCALRSPLFQDLSRRILDSAGWFPGGQAVSASYSPRTGNAAGILTDRASPPGASELAGVAHHRGQRPRVTLHQERGPFLLPAD